MTYSSVLKGITGVGIVFLILVTFFSRTLADLHIPRVSIGFIEQGTVRPEATSNGVVRPADTERIFAPSTGRITQILERGDTLNVHSVLFTISSDIDALQNSLDDAYHSRSNTLISIERTTSDRNNAQRELNLLQNEPLNVMTQRPTLNLMEYDIQLESNTNQVLALREEISSLETLYAQGIIPRQDIVSRENQIESLQQAREQIYMRRNRAVENYENAWEVYQGGIETAQRNRQAEIQTRQNNIAGHNFTLATHNLELTRLNRRIADLYEQIEYGGIVEVRLDPDSPTNRLITEVVQGLEVGSIIQEGTVVMTTAIRNNRFVVEASFPQTQDFIDVGQDVSVLVGTQRIDGTTTRVVPEGGRNTVYIDIHSNQLRGGESARVVVSGGQSIARNMIPINALNNDTHGYFILFVTPVERRFGNDYFVSRMNVEPGRRDERNVTISVRWGELPTSPIITNSDMPIFAGNRVRLVGAHELDIYW